MVIFYVLIRKQYVSFSIVYLEIEALVFTLNEFCMDYSRILVGVDGTDMDETLVDCAHYMAKICKATTVYIMHVARNLELPREIADQYPELKEPADESLERRFEELVGVVFSDLSHVSVHVEIKEGHPEKELLRWTKIKDIDLVIMQV